MTAPPPMPVMPPPVPIMRATGGAGHTVTVAMNPEDAYQSAIHALARAGAEVTWQSPPGAAKFTFIYKSFWYTGGAKITYNSDLMVTPAAPGQSQVSLKMAVNWGGMVPVFAMYAICGVIGLFLSYYGFFMVACCLIGACVSAWRLSSKTPEDEARKILQQVGPSMMGGAYMPQPQARPYTPPPAPAPAPPPQPAPQAVAPPPAAPAPTAAGGANEATVFDQIKRLAELRDVGALTPAEFEAKKAELLKRL